MLVVWKLGRLGRNLADLVNTVQDLSARGVGLRSASSRRWPSSSRELIREGTVAELKAAPGTWAQGRQEVRADESLGAAGPGRDGAPRHVGVRAVPRARHQAGDALPVRRSPGASCCEQGQKVLASLTAAAGLPPSTCCHTFRATGDHGVAVDRGDSRARAADRGARVSEDDEALRSDVGLSGS